MNIEFSGNNPIKHTCIIRKMVYFKKVSYSITMFVRPFQSILCRNKILSDMSSHNVLEIYASSDLSGYTKVSCPTS